MRLRLFITTFDEKKVKLADGSILKKSNISNVSLQVNGKTAISSFVILPKLNSKYDLILGMPYLSESNPDISCRDKTISWRTYRLSFAEMETKTLVINRSSHYGFKY